MKDIEVYEEKRRSSSKFGQIEPMFDGQMARSNTKNYRTNENSLVHSIKDYDLLAKVSERDINRLQYDPKSLYLFECRNRFRLLVHRFISWE